jgi:hypothetical protein
MSAVKNVGGGGGVNGSNGSSLLDQIGSNPARAGTRSARGKQPAKAKGGMRPATQTPTQINQKGLSPQERAIETFKRSTTESTVTPTERAAQRQRQQSEINQNTKRDQPFMGGASGNRLQAPTTEKPTSPSTASPQDRAILRRMEDFNRQLDSSTPPAIGGYLPDRGNRPQAPAAEKPASPSTVSPKKPDIVTEQENGDVIIDMEALIEGIRPKTSEPSPNGQSPGVTQPQDPKVQKALDRMQELIEKMAQ